jgi:hypothetical protein
MTPIERSLVWERFCSGCTGRCRQQNIQCASIVTLDTAAAPRHTASSRPILGLHEVFTVVALVIVLVLIRILILLVLLVSLPLPFLDIALAALFARVPVPALEPGRYTV